ncbi:MAG: hypothetical protein FWG22_02320 [Prolixibacteraceae bacterium]|nr:hypothetical protein [Prolixibacteraceae bacterium]
MEMEPANQWSCEKEPAPDPDKTEKYPMENLPPVSIFSLDDTKTYSFTSASNIAPFQQKIQEQDLLINKTYDDLEPIMPLLLKGLAFAVKDLCSEKAQIFFNHFGIEPGYGKRLTVFIYRAVIELIKTMQKHTEIQDIFVELITENDLLSVTIQNDGAGFDPEKSLNESLLNIAASVVSIGGQFHIYYSEGMSAEITIEIENPLESGIEV